MNDETKIKVLMIYYEHWGNEQNQLRKTIHGFNQLQEYIIEYTMSSLDTARENYELIDDEDEVDAFSEYIEKLYEDPSPSSLYECLKKCFEDEPIFDDEFMSDVSYENLIFFIDTILGGIGGNRFIDNQEKVDEITNNDLLGHKKVSIEYFCKTSDEANEILYDDSFTEEMVLSVEAIVAIL